MFLEVETDKGNKLINISQILEIGETYITVEYVDSEDEYIRYQITKEDIKDIKERLKYAEKII